jgi:hypothetical protein
MKYQGQIVGIVFSIVMLYWFTTVSIGECMMSSFAYDSLRMWACNVMQMFGVLFIITFFVSLSMLFYEAIDAKKKPEE